MRTLILLTVVLAGWTSMAGEVQTNVTVQAATSSIPLTAAMTVPSTNAQAPPAAASPDPMVGKVLLALATHLQSARNFCCDVSFLINSEMEGMKQEISATYALAAEKPNQLALRYLKGMVGNTVVCNGTNLITYAPMLNRYEETEAPKSFEQFSEGVGPMSGNMLFVDNLLHDDIYAAIMEGVIKATYAGKEVVDGVECDHLKFIQEQFEWDLWVSTGLKPVVIQVLSDMSKGLDSMPGDAAPPKGMKMTVLNRFSRWAVDSTLPTETFQFRLPAGAKKADSLLDGEDEDAAGRPAAIAPDAPKSTNTVDRR